MLTDLYRKFHPAFGRDIMRRRDPRVPFFVGGDPLLDPDFDDMDTVELARSMAPRPDRDEDADGEIAPDWPENGWPDNGWPG